MNDYSVRRNDTIILLVLFIAVNASMLLNHLLFQKYLPVSFYIISVVISVSIGAYGGLLAAFFLMHKINFNPKVLHVRGWDTSSGLLKALLEHRVMNINIDVTEISSIELNSKGNILTVRFAEDGLLVLSTDVYKRQDVETLVLLVNDHILRNSFIVRNETLTI